MKKIMTTSMSVLKANFYKRFLLTFIMTLTFVVSGFSVAKTSTGSTDWNLASTWTPAGVPGTGDDVTISAGHNVTMAANGTCRHLFLDGSLNMSSGSGITLDITNNSDAGNTKGITLGSGSSLFIGATNTVYFSNGQASGIVNNGGTIVSTGVNGADGGTIRLNTNSGGEFRFSGTATTTVNNLQFDGNANFRIESTLIVNGKLSVKDNNWSSSSSTLSPIYGPGSTLSVNWNGQAINGGTTQILNGALDKLWSTATGTVGTTPGYPNNVTLLNVGTSLSGVTLPAPVGNINVGWAPQVDVGLGGTLQIGDPTATGTKTGIVSLHAVPSFNSGGIIVDDASKLISPASGISFIDRGNFTLRGGTTGLFYNYGATINFAGSGTSASPQYISTTDASGIVPFTNVTVSNGTYVTLQDDVTIGGVLNLSSGYIGTSATNSLTVINSSTTAITGGSSTAFVDGPLSWTIPSTTSGNYVFPIGDLAGGAYLPLTLSSANSTTGTTVTAQGFNHNSFGSPGPTVTTLSNTEYWAVSTSTPFSSGAQVTVQRPSAVTPNNALASSGSSNGIYSAIGGSPNTGTPGIISNGGIGSGSPVYIVMVQAPLGVVRIGGTNSGLDASCNPTLGSIIAGGTGGKAPYTYSMTGAGGPFGSGTFTGLSKGTHQVWVKDANNNVATAFLEVLGSLLINGNNEDVDICTGQSTTLSASNLLNNSATYSWTSTPASVMLPSNTSPTITVSPTVATTYTVTSTVYNASANKITNGSFEAGSSGFTSQYTDRTGMGQYTDTPDGAGYFSITTSGINLCQWFSISGPANAPALAPQDGTKYFVGDGANSALNVWTQTVSGLTIGTTYQFSYYYAAASVSSPRASLVTSFTNPTVTTSAVSASNGSGWSLASYTFTPTATSTTITIKNNTTGIPGNDFYIDNIQMLPPCTMQESINVTINCTAPVELIDFNAVRQDQGALLTWETSLEINSSHFVVEKSTDGLNFTSIGTVKAAGNSSGIINYSFVDPYITSGVTYYRLVQYDLDGTPHYSEIRTVSKEGTGVQVVPNPNNGTFVVLLDNGPDSKTKISVINALGQLVYEGAESTANLRNVDISNLASGVYYLQVSSANETIVKKIIKD